MEKVLYVINFNGELDIDSAYYTLDNAKKALADLDEDEQYLCGIVKMKESEFLALYAIQNFAPANYREEIRKALFEDQYIDESSKEFVIEQLAKIENGDEICRNYFVHLIANELRIELPTGKNSTGDYDGICMPDIETFTEPVRLTFKEFFIKEVNKLIDRNFDKKVDISALLED